MEKLELSDIKVMLVDDDQDYVLITKMYLKSKGINIQGKTNPIEALESLNENPVDIILLDYFMPEMTGKEFIEKLRETNSQTIVILQTGFSEEKPPLEMLTELNIQGYHDKSRGVEDLLLLTLSAIRMVKLMKQNQEQKIEINRLNYKNEFIGSLLVGVINNAKSQLMAISTATKSVGQVTQECNDEISLIERAHTNLAETFQALNFDNNIEGVTLSQLKKTVMQLLKFKLTRELIQLEINTDSETQIINCKANTLIYMIIEVIKYLVENDEKNININCKNIDGLQIELPSFNYDEKIVEKLKYIAKEDNNVEIVAQDNNISIRVK